MDTAVPLTGKDQDHCKCFRYLLALTFSGRFPLRFQQNYFATWWSQWASYRFSSGENAQILMQIPIPFQQEKHQNWKKNTLADKKEVFVVFQSDQTTNYVWANDTSPNVCPLQRPARRVEGTAFIEREGLHTSAHVPTNTEGRIWHITEKKEIWTSSCWESEVKKDLNPHSFKHINLRWRAAYELRWDFSSCCHG